MKLHECQMGVVVYVRASTLAKELRIGHVVGLTKNVQDNPEVIPLVHFAAEPAPIPYHHRGLELLSEL